MDELLEELQRRRERMKTEWNRVLPTNELLYDRWAKAEFVGAGRGASLYDSALIFGDVRIGESTWIGPYTVLDGTGGGLSIGSFSSISAGVQIYTHDTVKWSLSGGVAPKVTGATAIGDNCYIGPMSIVTKGVTIGRCSVVGANSFVNRSVPEYSIVAGNPARKIGEVHIDANGEVKLVYGEK